MENKYLEKIASTALSRYVDKNSLPGSGRNGEPAMGAAQLNKAYTGATPKGPVLSGGTVQVSKKQLLTGRTIGMRNVPNTATRMSGDSLAAGPSLSQRLANHKKGLPHQSLGPATSIPGAKPPIPTKAPIAKGGLLNRALGFVKRNPVLAAGGALAGGVAAGRLLSSRKSEPTQGGYPQYM